MESRGYETGIYKNAGAFDPPALRVDGRSSLEMVPTLASISKLGSAESLLSSCATGQGFLISLLKDPLQGFSLPLYPVAEVFFFAEGPIVVVVLPYADAKCLS